MKHLVLFGDSHFARFGKDLLLQLEAELADYDVYNCAAGGSDSNVGAQKATYIASLKPDAVAISLGSNDAAPWKQVPLETFKANLDRIVETFSDSQVIIFLPPPVDATKQPDGLKRSNEIMEQYCQAAQAVASAHQATVINLESSQDYHIEDGLHLNQLGYDMLITQLAAAIKGGLT